MALRLAFLCGALLVAATHGLLSNVTAAEVTGQGGSFTSAVANIGGVSAASLWLPTGVAAKSDGDIAVSDSANHRVLLYTFGSYGTAAAALGQPGLTSGAAQITARGLNAPMGLAYSPTGDLFVADTGANRVLRYSSGAMATGAAATAVYGQRLSFTSFLPNNGGVNEFGLSQPSAVAVDSTGALWVCDQLNSRVLGYRVPSGALTLADTAAVRVIGQPGFASNATNRGAGIVPAADSLSAPRGLCFDGADAMYVSDGGNNRVLFFARGAATATRVYGQGGSFVAGAAGGGAGGLAQPAALALDAGGHLYCADEGNNRIVVYAPGGTVAVQVFGQPDFTSTAASVTAAGLTRPHGVTVDLFGRVFVADASANRMLRYEDNTTTTVARTSTSTTLTSTTTPLTTATTTSTTRAPTTASTSTSSSTPSTSTGTTSMSIGITTSSSTTTTMPTSASTTTTAASTATTTTSAGGPTTTTPVACGSVCERVDLRRDGVINALDLFELLALWGPCAGPATCYGLCVADFNGDGAVDAFDLFTLLAQWDVRC